MAVKVLIHHDIQLVDLVGASLYHSTIEKKKYQLQTQTAMQLWPVAIVCPGTVWFIPWDAAAWGGGARHEGRHLLVSLWSHGGLRQLLARCPVSPLPLQTGWGEASELHGLLVLWL